MKQCVFMHWGDLNLHMWIWNQHDMDEWSSDDSDNEDDSIVSMISGIGYFLKDLCGSKVWKLSVLY